MSIESLSFQTPPQLASYRQSVQNKINTDTTFLLNRYLATSPDAADAYNIGISAKKVASVFRPVNCIESLLLDFQIKRNQQMLTEPTEFLALFLKNASGMVRVYYLTDDINGLRKISSFQNLAKEDIKNGSRRRTGQCVEDSFFILTMRNWILGIG